MVNLIFLKILLKNYKIFPKIQDVGHCGPRRDYDFFLVNQSPKTKLSAKFQNFSIFCKAKFSIDWTIYNIDEYDNGVKMNL